MMLLRISALIVAFAFTAICVLPLRFAWAAAGAQTGLHVTATHGTIWSGQLANVTWRGLELGNLEITSSVFERPGDLIVRARSETGPLSSAAFALSSRGRTIENIVGAVDLAAILPNAPPNARMKIDDGKITVDDHRCVTASGNVSTDAIPAQGLPAVVGQLECRDGHIIAMATSADRLHHLTIRISLSADTRPAVIEASPATQLWLAALGIPVAQEGGL